MLVQITVSKIHHVLFYINPYFLKKIIHTELPESNVIILKIIDRSENGTGRLKISIKLAINLIEEVQELRRKFFDRNSQKSGQSLARLQ